MLSYRVYSNFGTPLDSQLISKNLVVPVATWFKIVYSHQIFGTFSTHTTKICWQLGLEKDTCQIEKNILVFFRCFFFGNDNKSVTTDDHLFEIPTALGQ